MVKRQKNKNQVKLLPFIREDLLSIQDVKQKIGWEITAFNLPSTWNHTQGEGVVVAVCDTGVDLNHEDLKSNLLPGKNFVQPNNPPQDDNGHGCVHPNTFVHTSFSGIETIESLYNRLQIETVNVESKDGKYEVKDISKFNVLTYSFDVEKKTSELGEITSIQKLPINGSIIKVELEGGEIYHLTPWHPVYLLKNRHHKIYDVIRKRADQICIGDGFIFGKGELAGKLGSPIHLSLPHSFSCSQCSHQPKYWSGLHPSFCKKCGNKFWKIETKNFEITESLAYLAGITLTDGHVSNDRIEIASITPEILQKIKKITNHLNWSSKVEEKRILIYGKTAVQTLVAMGIKQGNKSLVQDFPDWVGLADHKSAAAFIAGVIDGDGCISKTNTKNRITTASLEFARICSCFLNSLGISSSVSKPFYDKRQHRKIKSNNPCYKITHGPLTKEIIEHLTHPLKIERSKIIPKYNRSFRRVKSISVEQYNGYFYDFTVNLYHNYIANGHFVSNSHVTGIICACNNELGIVGVAPKTKVIPVKVLDKRGAGNLKNVADGVCWAADQGVDFITMSLGSPSPIPIVQKAIKYAISKGVVVWCAAGNAGKTRKIFYPANYPETIGVGAIDENFSRATFSCTGDDLDFLAPGVKILSTVPDNWYSILSGTSMANPFAVGVACLLLSYKKNKGLNIPLKTAEDYRIILKKHTTPIKDSSYAGQKFFEGFGIIDPRKLEEWVRSHK